MHENREKEDDGGGKKGTARVMAIQHGDRAEEDLGQRK